MKCKNRINPKKKFIISVSHLIFLFHREEAENGELQDDYDDDDDDDGDGDAYADKVEAKINNTNIYNNKSSKAVKKSVSFGQSEIRTMESSLPASAVSEKKTALTAPPPPPASTPSRVS